jgi:hypothetical protein
VSEVFSVVHDAQDDDGEGDADESGGQNMQQKTTNRPSQRLPR